MGRVSMKLFLSRVERGTHEETTFALPKPKLLLLRVCGSYSRPPPISISSFFSPLHYSPELSLTTRPSYSNLFTLLSHPTRPPSLTMPIIIFLIVLNFGLLLHYFIFLCYVIFFFVFVFIIFC